MPRPTRTAPGKTPDRPRQADSDRVRQRVTRKCLLPIRSSDQHEAAEATQRATRCLAALGLSARDTGEVLGISHQRAQQLRSG